jgi:hypothetical protein
LAARFPRVSAWEIWNVPDGGGFWVSSKQQAQNAADYAALLKAAYPAVKSANPHAKVVGPVLSNGGTWAASWLAAFYSALPQGFYDTLSAHMYCDPPSHGNSNPAQMVQEWNRNIGSLIAANGDRSTELWITETGVNTVGSTADQAAALLTQTFGEIERQLNVSRVYWYEFNDDDANPNASSSYGLTTIGLQPKPGLAAFNALP